HQGVLPESHDVLRRRVVADSHSKLRRSLSQRAPSSGPREPTHPPRSGPPRKRGKGPTPAAPGWHAELLLPSRCLRHKVLGSCPADRQPVPRDKHTRIRVGHARFSEPIRNERAALWTPKLGQGRPARY